MNGWQGGAQGNRPHLAIVIAATPPPGSFPEVPFWDVIEKPVEALLFWEVERPTAGDGPARLPRLGLTLNLIRE